MNKSLGISIAVWTLVAMFFTGCDEKPQVTCGTTACKQAMTPPAASQKQLLELAFKTASSIPEKPHIKDRCKAQQEVVITCLKLKKPLLAEKYTQKITNWRQGYCFANIAMYYAIENNSAKAEYFIKLAENVAETAQDWRKDRIKSKISQVYAKLGLKDESEKIAKGIETTESGKVGKTLAQNCSEADFNEIIKQGDEYISSGQFDKIRNAHNIFVELFNRFYDQPKRRNVAEEKLRATWSQQPVFLRIELMMSLAKSAIEHDDLKKAIELVNEAQKERDSANWPLRFGISLKARMAGLRWQAGDKKTARANLDATLAEFEAEKKKIVNIDRAEILNDIAHSYNVMQAYPFALEVYKKALQESLVNPNSRPRAEDIVSICCSMASDNAMIDSVMWKKLNDVSKGLSKPW